MRKKMMTVALTCLICLGSKAQVFAGDSWVQLPTRDLYDTGSMNMYTRALAETAAARQELFYRYSDMALEAYKNHKWNYAIYYVNEALNTQYYSGSLYYIRGYAYEQLGNIKAAKKDYKKGVKYNCVEAARALESLKARRKSK